MSAPPIWLVRILTRVTAVLARLRRRLIPPEYAALDLGTMSWIALALSAFCRLGLADELARGPSSAAQLGASVRADSEMIFRLLRSLAAYDVVRYVGHGKFALGHVGRGLTGERSVAPMILYANAPWHVAPYARLDDAMRANANAFEIANGMREFEYLARNPEAGAIFDAAMQCLAQLFADAIEAAYDFSQMNHVVDIGGGTGHLLVTLVQRYPNLRGTVFELPAVAERARLKTVDQPRITVAEGNILVETPPLADAYIMSHILHDWADDACARMLQNVRSSMTADAKLLVYEIVARRPDNSWSLDRLTDLEMMTMLSGKERTELEFMKLFASSGLRWSRTIPTASAESILEVVKGRSALGE